LVAILLFSGRARSDLVGIGTYTLRTWGERQAERYIGDLHERCRMLADNPALGRACDDVRPALRRLEFGQHVVFYRVDARGILVSRILHQRMLASKQAIEYEDD
jgi:toxin ParE1/3/4